jgi:hypothetical protein
MARQRITCHKKVGDFLKNNCKHQNMEFFYELEKRMEIRQIAQQSKQTKNILDSVRNF